MSTLQTKLCQAPMHTHANKERKLRSDLCVVTLQIVLNKEKKKKEKKKETKTCGVLLDSACGCCKNYYNNRYGKEFRVTVFGMRLMLSALLLQCIIVHNELVEGTVDNYATISTVLSV